MNDEKVSMVNRAMTAGEAIGQPERGVLMPAGESTGNQVRANTGKDRLKDYAYGLRRQADEIEALARALPDDISDYAQQALRRLINKAY